MHHGGRIYGDDKCLKMLLKFGKKPSVHSLYHCKILRQLKRHRMKIIPFLSLLIFTLSWQKFSFALLFLVFPFYALYRENFIILWAKKRIIKKATLYKGSFLDKFTQKNSALICISLVIALFALLSLSLNLMTASLFELSFLFLIYPLFFIFVRKISRSQFRKNPYNTLRIIIFSAFFTALIYAFLELFFREKFEPFWYLNHYLDLYKSSVFAPLDTLSQALHFVGVLKNFAIFFSDIFWAKFLVFIFDFVNFFLLCSSFALLCSFVIKDKKSLILWLFLGLCAVLFFNETLNIKPKFQEKFSFYLQNLPTIEQNLSKIQEKSEIYKDEIAKFRDILDKNAFEIAIWWLSDEKDEFKKRLNEALK